MHFSYIDSIFNLVVLGIHVFMQLAAAVLIYIKHHEPQNRAWYYIFLFFIISALASSVEIILIVENSLMLDSYKILNPYIIVPGFYIFSLLMCYIIANVRPQWLNLGRLALLLAPSAIMAAGVFYYVFQGEIVNIYSISRLQTLLFEPNVLVRLLFISLYLPYVIIMIVMRFKWKNARLQKYFDMMIMLTILLCLSYIGSRGLQIFTAYIIHELLYLLLTVFIIYTEYYERIHIPLESVRTYYEQPEVPTNTQITINNVAQNLRDLMANPEVWKDPELTNDKIVHLVATNRTYIQLATKQMGFANLTDMLHRRRIEYVCEELRKDPNAVIQDLFYDAGYRSRATAWRHFTNIVGHTPTEFIRRNITPPHVSIYK